MNLDFHKMFLKKK